MNFFSFMSDFMVSFPRQHYRHIKFRKLCIGLAFAITSVLSLSLQAVEPTYTALFSSKAIKGYDTVAYFTQGKPVQGSEEYSTEYNKATWLFSSQENLELFTANLEKYAPQYGGYCAYAVSKNSTASIKPKLFTIVEGKLYLNYNQSINEKWLANKQDFIVQADKNWPALIAEKSS
ncbi:MAG: YHS domain-containing protein [Arenicella sp.]|jgi:YHS domain-containing protein